MNGTTTMTDARVKKLNEENDILLTEVEFLEQTRDDLKKAYDNAITELDGLRQTSALLCDDCGWSMKFPDCGCVYCGFHRMEKEPRL